MGADLHCHWLGVAIQLTRSLQEQVYAPEVSRYISLMDSYIDWVRAFCMSLPHATENIQWEHDLLFRIAGKIFCVANLEPAMSPAKVAFKCTPEKFTELVEIEGIIPAPYMARNHWVALVEMDALRTSEIKELIQGSYQLVLEKLPKKLQATLSGAAPAKPSPAPRRKARKTVKAKPGKAAKRRQ